MITQEYLHFTHRDKSYTLLEKGYIDNTDIPKSQRFTGESSVIALQRDKSLMAVRAFMYDIEKIKSRYTRTLPFVHNTFIKKKRLGSLLGILPRYVDMYDLSQFRAILFNVKSHARSLLEDNYMQDTDSGERVYFETVSPVRVYMEQLMEMDVEQACERIIGMRPPFATYRFPEGYDGYEGRSLKSMANTTEVCHEFMHLVK